MSEFPSLWASGIRSSTTTNIIAPAAKLKAYGKRDLDVIVADAPKTADMGSTMAESWP